MFYFLLAESFNGAVSGVDLSFLPNTEMLTYRLGCVFKSSINMLALLTVLVKLLYKALSFINKPKEPLLELTLSKMVFNVCTDFLTQPQSPEYLF